MRKTILYLAAGVSLALLARKLFPSLVRELRLELM
jgi:hypothetical protein